MLARTAVAVAAGADFVVERAIDLFWSAQLVLVSWSGALRGYERDVIVPCLALFRRWRRDNSPLLRRRDGFAELFCLDSLTLGSSYSDQ
jgi:hypothetical protein